MDTERLKAAGADSYFDELFERIPARPPSGTTRDTTRLHVTSSRSIVIAQGARISLLTYASSHSWTRSARFCRRQPARA